MKYINQRVVIQVRSDLIDWYCKHVPYVNRTRARAILVDQFFHHGGDLCFGDADVTMGIFDRFGNIGPTDTEFDGFGKDDVIARWDKGDEHSVPIYWNVPGVRP